MSKEEDEKVIAGFLPQMNFFLKYYGLIWFICSQLGMAFFVACRLTNDYILGEWAYKPENQHTRFSVFAPLCIGMCFVISFSIGIRGITMQIFTWFAARRLFTDMITTVANAPVNLYFD